MTHYAHPLRVARALVLAAAALPACSAADEANADPSTFETTAPSATTVGPIQAPPPVGVVAAAEAVDAGVDGAIPHSSGPVVPPEMPEHFG